jgi:hypothetical protein
VGVGGGEGKGAGTCFGRAAVGDGSDAHARMRWCGIMPSMRSTPIGAIVLLAVAASGCQPITSARYAGPSATPDLVSVTARGGYTLYKVDATGRWAPISRDFVLRPNTDSIGFTWDDAGRLVPVAGCCLDPIDKNGKYEWRHTQPDPLGDILNAIAFAPAFLAALVMIPLGMFHT